MKNQPLTSLSTDLTPGRRGSTFWASQCAVGHIWQILTCNEVQDSFPHLFSATSHLCLFYGFIFSRESLGIAHVLKWKFWDEHNGNLAPVLSPPLPHPQREQVTHATSTEMTAATPEARNEEGETNTTEATRRKQQKHRLTVALTAVTLHKYCSYSFLTSFLHFSPCA